MSKLDKTKEILNTLRASFGIAVALIVTITTGLINIYNKGNIDTLFYIGAILDIIFLLSLPIIIKHIIKNMKSIEEL